MYGNAIRMDRLEQILSSRGRAAVFKLLFGLQDGPFHLRELARRGGLTVGGVQHEVDRLLELDLIIKTRDGNRVQFEPNKNNPLYSDIHNLVIKTGGFTDLLKNALNVPEIEYAFVFGSIASGDDKSSSDVDIIIIGSLGLRKVASLLSGLSLKIGREINPVVISKKEFARRLHCNDHFISRVWKDDKLFIKGSESDIESVENEWMVEKP